MDSPTRLRLGIGLAAFLILVVVLGAVNSRISALEKRRAVRESQLTEMMKLKSRYRDASAGSQRLANRLLSTRPDD